MDKMIARAFAKRELGGDVYIVDEGFDDSAVKIGFASIGMAARMPSLQTGNPRTLRLLHAEEASVLVERLIHNLLAQSRGVGEWFDRSPRVRLFVVMATHIGLRATMEHFVEHNGGWARPGTMTAAVGKTGAQPSARVLTRLQQRQEWHRAHHTSVGRARPLLADTGGISQDTR